MHNYKKFIKIAAIMTTFVASLDNSYAASGFAIGPKIGLEGFGVEGRANIADNLYGRLGVNYFGYTPKLKSSTLNYKVTLTMLTVPLMLDYHPIDGSGFRVSAGVAYNGLEQNARDLVFRVSVLGLQNYCFPVSNEMEN
jgi:hypothetical protein